MAKKEGARPLVQEVLGRLTADKKPDPERDMLVLAALDGRDALSGYLDGNQARPRPEEVAAAQQPPTREPLGAYLEASPSRASAASARRRRSTSRPAPASRSSSAATAPASPASPRRSSCSSPATPTAGATAPRSGRTAGATSTTRRPPSRAELALEGEQGACTVVARVGGRRRARGRRGLGAGPRQAAHGRRGPRLDATRSQSYRPFLSYNELGSMLDEGPSKLYDALATILGLDELVDAQDALQKARNAREKAHEGGGPRARDDARRGSARSTDDRARGRRTALEREGLGPGRGRGDPRRPPPARRRGRRASSSCGASPASGARRPSAVDAAGASLREAARSARRAAAQHRRRQGRATSPPSSTRRSRFHEAHGDGDCPVCGRERRARQRVARSSKAEGGRSGCRDAAREAPTPRTTPPRPPRRKRPALRRRRPAPLAQGRPTSASSWPRPSSRRSTPGAPASPAAELERSPSTSRPRPRPLAPAIAALRAQAAAELQRREDAWRPLALELAAWLPTARQARKGAGHQAPQEGRGVAQGRRGRASATSASPRSPSRPSSIWDQLRLQSNVALDGIRLERHRHSSRAGRARRHRRRPGGRRARRHEPGRAALPRPQPLHPPRHAAREPVPLHRHRRPRPVDGPRARRRPRPRPRRAAARTARSSSSPTTTACPRPSAASASRPRSSRSRGARARSSSCAGPRTPSSRYIEDAMAVAKTDGPAAAGRPPRHPRPLPHGHRGRLHGGGSPPPARPGRAPRRRSRTLLDRPQRHQAPRRPRPLRRREARRRGPVAPEQGDEGTSPTSTAWSTKAPTSSCRPPVDLVRSAEKLAGWLQSALMTPAETLAMAQQLLERASQRRRASGPAPRLCSRDRRWRRGWMRTGGAGTCRSESSPRAHN